MNPNASLACQDALAWLMSLPTDSADLVFGSPPYSGKFDRYSPEVRSAMGNPRGKEWANWMADIVQECLRVCRGLVAFVVDSGTEAGSWDAAPARLMTELDDRLIEQLHPGCFNRVGIGGTRRDLRNDWEFIVRAKRSGDLPFVDPQAAGKPPKYRAGGPMSNRNADGTRVPKRKYKQPTVANPGNVTRQEYDASEVAALLVGGDLHRFAVGGGHMGSPLAHKCVAPFPEKLAGLYVRTFCPPGGLCLDPFVGSGTVAAASLKAGRRFSGCDLDPAMIALSQERIAAL